MPLTDKGDKIMNAMKSQSNASERRLYLFALPEI